jgi:uncharacterized protein (DUF885 family)
MRRTITDAVAAVCCALLAACQSAPHPDASLESRLAAQNAILEAQYQYQLKAHPLQATQYGDFRYNDRLDDYSLAAIRSEQRANQEFIAQLQAISTAGFAEEDRLSHEVMLRVLQQQTDDFHFKEYEMPVSQMRGVHVDIADLPLSVPLDSVQHYDDYIARLHQIARALEQTQEVLRAGMKDRLMPVRFLLEKVPDQCRGIIASDPFLSPTHKFPDDFGPEERARLTRAIDDAVSKEVLPAYEKFAAFIATDYAPHGRRSLGINSLPGGESRYLNDIHSYTTVRDLTPAQIHALGLREVQRVEAEMLELARSQGFADLAAFRQSLANNPKYRPGSAEQILDDFRHYVAQMRPKLPDLFGIIPDSPLTVEAIPAFQGAAATHYVVGTPDGKRPGRVVVATSDFLHRSLINDEAIAYHEGIPGHHMQLSLAEQLTNLPKFRQHLDNSGYVEGWALYAEQLGKEVGFYQDPGSDYGRLSTELFRAVRLVVDTGIHSMGWSREQVVDYFRESHAIDEPSIQTETDRYIALPGQALSYKLGQLKFRELRERAQRELGPAFDLRAFHDEMLSAGVLPLDLLDERTNSWIQRRLQGSAN